MPPWQWFVFDIISISPHIRHHQLHASSSSFVRLFLDAAMQRREREIFRRLYFWCVTFTVFSMSPWPIPLAIISPVAKTLRNTFGFGKVIYFNSFSGTMRLNKVFGVVHFLPRAHSMQNPSSLETSWFRWLFTISSWCFRVFSSFSRASCWTTKA